MWGEGESIRVFLIWSLHICGILSAPKQYGKHPTGPSFFFFFGKSMERREGWHNGRGMEHHQAGHPCGRNWPRQHCPLHRTGCPGRSQPLSTEPPAVTPSSGMLSLSLEAKCGALSRELEQPPSWEGVGPYTSCYSIAPTPGLQLPLGARGSQGALGGLSCACAIVASPFGSLMMKAAPQTLTLVPAVP